MIGQTLSHYRITAALGAGGMGEVYRASDTRLGREVAIKVLPAGFASDPDRRARFEREAQAVAALSHPNIVAIHDTGLSEGDGSAPPQAFVVMELLTGQTLRERLASGALPVRKAVDIAVQVARGLGAAHGKGIVHRDLKPENIFVLEDGQVKILDFGLARPLAAPSAASETVAATDPGTVLGTVGYMAPEQVRGQAVDARADVFALGIVLYEMVTGTRAFQRDTPADTMTAILTTDPPELAGSRPDLSPALDRIIRHCLEKNPAERFQSARDVAFALEALSGSAASDRVQAAVGTAPAPRRRGGSPVLVALLVVIAAAAGAAVSRMIGGSAPAPLKFTMKTFESQAIFNARFMPDGETIVFSSALVGNTPHLYEIRPGTLEARPFGPPDTHLLSVSAKGELAVLTNATHLNHRLFSGTLASMTLEGAPRPLLNRVREADWGPDGSALAVIRDLGGRDQLEYPAGTKLYEANGYLSDPRVSPDGTRVAFMEHPQRYDDRGYVKVVDASGKVTTLAGEFWGEEGVTWTPDGSEVLFGASARASEGREPGEMSSQIYRAPASGSRAATFALTSPGDFTIHDIAPNGRWLATRDALQYGVVARGAGQAEERDLTWLDKSWGPQLSRDGQRIVFADGNGGADYSVAWRKVDGSPIVRLGAGDSLGFSPDGRWALGVMTSQSQIVVYPMGAGDPIRLDSGPVTHIEAAGWWPDSTSVFMLGSETGKRPRYYRQPLADGSPTPFLPEEVAFALVAPDGSVALGVSGDGSAALYPIGGGPSTPVPAIQSGEIPFAFSEDSRTLFVQVPGRIPAVVDRIDLRTGQRSFFREFAPADRSGLIRINIGGPVLKADGSQYAYGYLRRPSVLFVVSGQGR